MDIDNAYDILKKISEKNTVDSNDLPILLQLSQCDDSEIRVYIAELLVLSKDNKAEKMLIHMCDDEDELVRANACDSLSVFPSIETYNCLIKNILTDISMLVKTYAILSIIDILNHVEIDTKELKSLLILNLNAEEIYMRAACRKGLYILGDDEQLEELINLLHSDNYQDRCAVLNILEDIMVEKNKHSILSAVKQLQQTEDSVAVNLIIDRILKKNDSAYHGMVTNIEDVS